MLDRLKAIFAGETPSPENENGDEVSLALTALMLEAARADEQQTATETALIQRALTEGFGLTPAAATALISRAGRRQADSVDLHQFTRVAKTLPHAEKIAFVETLWRIVLSDDARDPYEDAVIRRIASLIYVSDPESGAARLRVEAARAG